MPMAMSTVAALTVAFASGCAGLRLDDSGTVLRLFDRKTRSHIVLVGTIHFNPTSIAIADAVVRREGEAGRLRAVVVESCPTRWNSTLRVQGPGTVLRSVCNNEMQAAADVANEYGCALELGDQTIEETGTRVVQLLALTLVQLFTPFTGGWARISEDVACGLEQLSFPNGVTALALLNPLLLAYLPVSLFRYIVSIAVKSPAVLLVITVALGLPLALTDSGLLDAGNAAVDGLEPVLSDIEEMRELVAAVAFAALETIILGRVVLVGLLEERNFVLVRSIRRAALAKAPVGKDTVVAVLGMAHLNGVLRILKTSRVV